MRKAKGMGEETSKGQGTAKRFGLPALLAAGAVALAIGLGIGMTTGKGASPEAESQATEATEATDTGSVQGAESQSWMDYVKQLAKDEGINGEELYKPSNASVDEWMRICVNRADFENVKLVDGPVYVIGHKNPDADTVCSAIAYANLLNELGIDAQPVIAGDINRETAYILDHAGVATPQVIDNVAGKNVCIVDHSEYAQAVDGLDEANVIAIVDHHNTGSVETYDAVIYDGRPAGSTADIVWRNYMNYGVDLNKQMAEILLGATMSDTKILKADSTTMADYLASASLADIAGIDDIKAYYDEMSRARLSLDGMSDRQVFENDLREYEFAGSTYCIAVVEIFDEDEAAGLVERMKAEMEAEKAERALDYMYAQVTAFHDDVSFTYLVPVDEASRELAEATFGQEENCTWDGTSFVFKPGCGRKTYLVPKLNETLDKRRDLANAA